MTDTPPTSAAATISMTLNGVSARFATGSTVADVVLHLGLGGKRIAVERNQDIVPKSQHASTVLAPGDVIEIVHAIGGG